MRFSKKKQYALSILSNDEKFDALWDIYIQGTSIINCSKLFNTTEDVIIRNLKILGCFEYKMCSLCCEIRPFNMFYNNKSMAQTCGVSGRCKCCQSSIGKQYFKDNQDKKQAYDTQYKRQPHVRKLRLEYQKKHYTDPQNKQKLNKWANVYYHNNIHVKLNRIMGTMILKLLKNGKEGLRTVEILGYSMDELKCHLESQFDSNMNWENHGLYWEIDHIIPKSKFIYTSKDDLAFKQCWGLTNLRPFPKTANRKKYNKTDEDIVWTL